MEEVSFRSGAAAVGGVLAAAGAAITLAVVLGGPGDAVASAPASRAPVPSVASPSPVPASSLPQATPRPSRTKVPATVAGDFRPPRSPARRSAARRAATTPVPGSTPTQRPFYRRWLPGHPHLPGQPGWRGWRRPPASWSWGLWPRHLRR